MAFEQLRPGNYLTCVNVLDFCFFLLFTSKQTRIHSDWAITKYVYHNNIIPWCMFLNRVLN